MPTIKQVNLSETNSETKIDKDKVTANKTATKKTSTPKITKTKSKSCTSTAITNADTSVDKTKKTKACATKTTNAKANCQDKPKKVCKTNKANTVDINSQLEKEARAGKKILFVASEALPFVKTGGLADVAGSLPKALNKLGADCRVILPYYLDIKNEFRQTMQFLGNCYVSLAWRYQYCGVFTYKYQNVTYYFIDNEYYFKRHGLYGYYDDAERFAFFSKAVLESLNILDFTPDIIHCNDWHTALVPVFLDTFYRNQKESQNTKTVFTIHNIEFQGKYGEDVIGDILGLPMDKSCLVENDGCSNYMKGGIECSNAVTTVSPTYANEILNPYYGYGLDNILSKRKFKLSGIINGIDIETIDPNVDKAIFKNYSLQTIGDKAFNKKGLQEMLDLAINPNVPLIGMVGRLTHQKGMDILESCLEDILSKNNVQIVILGTGDWKYENFLKELQQKYIGKLRVIINFSSDMASKIYAGSDMFLMPSKFEPCGLSQMIAMRYGSIPIVRETGGLKDTVKPFDSETKIGCGITFYDYTCQQLEFAVERAVGLYNDYKDLWATMVENAMTQDFSWDNIAKKYMLLYYKI